MTKLKKKVDESLRDIQRRELALVRIGAERKGLVRKGEVIVKFVSSILKKQPVVRVVPIPTPVKKPTKEVQLVESPKLYKEYRKVTPEEEKFVREFREAQLKRRSTMEKETEEIDKAARNPINKQLTKLGAIKGTAKLLAIIKNKINAGSRDLQKYYRDSYAELERRFIVVIWNKINKIQGVKGLHDKLTDKEEWAQAIGKLKKAIRKKIAPKFKKEALNLLKELYNDSKDLKEAIDTFLLYETLPTKEWVTKSLEEL